MRALQCSFSIFNDAFTGADWLLMLGYRTFSWGDRLGTVEALGVLPQHRLDQRLAEHVKNLWQS